MSAAPSLMHCNAETCTSTRRTVKTKAQTVFVCGCNCAPCGELARLYSPLAADATNVYHEVRVRHPVSGEKFWIVAKTAESFTQLVNKYHRIRASYRDANATPDETNAAIKRLMYGTRSKKLGGYGITLEEALSWYKNRGNVARNTLRRLNDFLKELTPELRARAMTAWTQDNVKEWIATQEASGYAESTIRLRWRTLRGVASYMIEIGKLEAYPWPNGWWPKVHARKPPQREATRTPDELARLIEAAGATDEETEAKGDLGQLQPMIVCGSFLGLRQQEIAGLRWPDFDAARLRVRIARQGAEPWTKTRRVRIVATLPAFFELLERHAVQLKKHRLYKKTGPVFPGPESTPGQPRPFGVKVFGREKQLTVERAEAPINNDDFRACVARAGLPDPHLWTVHSLKDSFATLEQATYGNDLKAMQARTGHEDPWSVVRYLRTLSRREVPPPGFQLPPLAKRPLALPQTATSGEDCSSPLAGGTPHPPAFADGPLADAPIPNARGTLEELARSTAAVNVAALTEADTSLLNEARELVSLVLVPHVEPDAEPQKNERAGAGAFEGDQDGSLEQRERSAFSRRKRSI